LVGREKLPPKFVAKMDRMEPCVSVLSVHLGLDEDFRSTLKDNEDYEIIVSDTYDPDRDYQWCINCDVEHASFFLTLYSNIEDTFAKDNKFVIGITQGQNYDYWKKYEKDYFAGNKKEYNKEKERIARLLIKRAEKVVPGLSEHIEVMEVATPLTLKRYTGNFNGSLYGWAETVNQFTPMDRMTSVPIKNLYLSSAWTFPGGGQMSVIACGYRLGRQLIGR
jgi:prolycopene isomerase